MEKNLFSSCCNLLLVKVLPSVFYNFFQLLACFDVGTGCTHGVLCLNINRKSGERAKIVHRLDKEKNSNVVAF